MARKASAVASGPIPWEVVSTRTNAQADQDGLLDAELSKHPVDVLNEILEAIAARRWGRRSAMAGQVDPDDAVRFGELLGLLPPELAGGRKAVDENQRKPLTGDAYERVAYRHVSRRHHSCC
jgi:hypothetical protein